MSHSVKVVMVKSKTAQSSHGSMNKDGEQSLQGNAK